jgi:hypothetical protein
MSNESQAIIQKHGFKDATEFQRVGYNAALAYSVVRQGGKDAVNTRLDRAETRQKESLDRLRAQLTPDQYKLLEGQVAGALSTARALRNVPDGNIEIMKKYQGRMEKLGKE